MIVAWHYEKTKIMKPKTVNYEILLFTCTRFISREFCSRSNESDNGRNLSPMEELEKACWGGVLYEMFPEILGSFSAKCECFMWQIMSGKNYLRISMGPEPAVFEIETVIDPYFFMLSACKN